MRPPIAFILVLAACGFVAAKNPYLSIPLDDADVLKPFVHESNSQAVEEAYRQLLRKTFRYELRATGKPHVILAELAKMTSADVFTGLKKDTQEYLTLVAKNVFIANKFNLESPALAAGFADLSIDYSARALQITLDKMDGLDEPDAEDSRGLIDASVIVTAFDEFVAEQRLVLTADKRNAILKAATEAFMDGRARATGVAYSLAHFRSKGREIALKMAKQLLDFAFALPTVPAPEDTKIMAAKVMGLVRFVALVSSPEEDFNFMASIGRVLTQDHLAWQVSNRLFVDTVVRKILKAVAGSSRVDHMKVGKEILVSYFVHLGRYPPPTDEYKAFIVRKYRKAGLRFQFANLNAEYDRMLRIYALDVVHASMFLDYELLEPADLKALLLGFQKLAENYSVQEQAMFTRMRTSMLTAGPIMQRLPLLFESLYDSLLHASQYYTHGFRGIISSTDEYASLYDEYLDYLYSWKTTILLNRVWRWEPDPKLFPINIEENYAFFKLINIVSNAIDMSRKSVSFSNFAYQNNYWIHRYTTEEAPRRLLNFLRNRLFPNGAFNYQHLRGLTITADTLAAYVRYANHADEI